MEEFHLILQIEDRYDNVDTKIMFNANRQLVKDTLIKMELDNNVTFDYSLVVATQNILISLGALEVDLETTVVEDECQFKAQKEILWSLIDEVNTKIKSVRDEQARAKKQQLEKEKKKKEREKHKKQKSKAEKEVELYNKLKQKYEK